MKASLAVAIFGTGEVDRALCLKSSLVLVQLGELWMAPVLSKPAGPTESKGNDWLALLCGKAAEQAREVARDLAEVTDYIMRCVTLGHKRIAFGTK